MSNTGQRRCSGRDTTLITGLAGARLSQIRALPCPSSQGRPNGVVMGAGCDGSGGLNVDVYEAVTSRRAVRAFTEEPVPREALERVVSAAAWSPSGSNLQPWNTYVVTGARLAELKTCAVERVAHAVIRGTSASTRCTRLP